MQLQPSPPLDRSNSSHHPGDSPSDSPKEYFHIASLDGIRAVAALIVFISHCGLEKLVPGGFGVTIFFFLSGFLITTLLRVEHEKHGKISLRNFYLRRVYRIAPPVYIVLLLLLTPFLHRNTDNHLTPLGMVAQFSQLTNYYLIANGPYSIIPGSAQIWSLAVEEHFYLIFPIVLIFALRYLSYRAIAIALGVVCIGVLAWRCIGVIIFGFGKDYTYMATECRIDSLLYGCIMAIALNPARDAEPQYLRSNSIAWMSILIASVTTLVFTLLYRDPVFRETLRYSLQGIALFPIFYCAVKYPQWWIFSWLNTRPMRAMGLISYTFYLAHVKALGVTARYLPAHTLTWALTGFAAAALFSIAMYWLVERRLAALRKKLHE